MDCQPPYFPSPHASQSLSLQGDTTTAFSSCPLSQPDQAWVCTIQSVCDTPSLTTIQVDSTVDLLDTIQQMPTIHARATQSWDQRQKATTGHAGIVTALLPEPAFPIFGRPEEALGGGRDSLSGYQCRIQEDIEVSRGKPTVGLPIPGHTVHVTAAQGQYRAWVRSYLRA